MLAKTGGRKRDLYGKQNTHMRIAYTRGSSVENVTSELAQ